MDVGEIMRLERFTVALGQASESGRSHELITRVVL
jgi:hypothetical protein